MEGMKKLLSTVALMQIQRGLCPDGCADDEVRRRWKVERHEMLAGDEIRVGGQVRMIFAMGETRPPGWDETWEPLYTLTEQDGIYTFWNVVLNTPLEWPDSCLVVAFGKLFYFLSPPYSLLSPSVSRCIVYSSRPYS